MTDLFRRRRIETVFDVAEAQLCTGCGICASIAPHDVEMVDDPRHGRRPIKIGDGAGAAMALRSCPGIQLVAEQQVPGPSDDTELFRDWGPIKAMWEGHASSADLRFRGSSGGMISALAVHALAEGFDGVLHIGADPERPWTNRTFHSTTPVEVTSRAGSRYAPASPGDGLGLLSGSTGRHVFIGKPCDVAGLQMARRHDPSLDARIGLTIAMFCAGTPSTDGTRAMLTAMGVDDVETLTSLSYRGNGWPGDATARWVDEDGEHTAQLTYQQSWGDILQKHRQWRCMICPDHTGESADIAIGDPWWRPTDGDPGRSLVVARTELGRAFVDRAAQTDGIAIESCSNDRLPLSQPNLLKVRGTVWGRVAALRLVGLPTPRFTGMATFSAWRALSVRDQTASIVGTLRRVRRRGLHRRAPVTPAAPSDGARVTPVDRSA